MMKIKIINYILSFFLCYTQLLHSVSENTVVATINVGVTPDGIAVTPDNKFAYVVNNNNYSIPNGDSVSVLNLTKNILETTITHSSFNEPYTVTISPSGQKVYVPNSNSSTVTIINALTNKVSGVINGFDGPSGFAINSLGTLGYVNNYGGPGGAGSGNGKTISVVNLKNNTIIDTIIVDQAPAGIAISPDNKRVYVINYVDGNPGTGTLNIIATNNNKVIGTIKGFSGPFSLAVSPDGNFAYVANFGSNNFQPIGTTVSIVDLKNRVIIKNVQVGIQPAGVAVTPNGQFIYATNYNTLYAGPGFTNLVAGGGTVNIIDARTYEVVTPVIAVGQSPNRITFSPDGKFAYVTNFTSNTVNVILVNQPAAKSPLNRSIIKKYGCG